MNAAISATDAYFEAQVGDTWQDYPAARWLSQIMHGLLPGLLMVWAVLQLAARPSLPDGSRESSASVLPLVGLAVAADTATFHRYGFSHSSPADAAPRSRQPDPERHEEQRPRRTLTVTKRVSALPVSFNAPRQTWSHLDSQTRGAIDTGLQASAAMPQPWQRAVLHGSRTTQGSLGLLARYYNNGSLRSSLSSGKTQPYHFVIGNGSGSSDGRVEVGAEWLHGSPAIALSADPGLSQSISICLVGDFSSAPPTSAQLTALDELLDYLSIKLGPVPVTTHRLLTGSEHGCLGAKFPEEAVLSALK